MYVSSLTCFLSCARHPCITKILCVYFLLLSLIGEPETVCVHATHEDNELSLLSLVYLVRLSLLFYGVNPDLQKCPEKQLLTLGKQLKKNNVALGKHLLLQCVEEIYGHAARARLVNEHMQEFGAPVLQIYTRRISAHVLLRRRL